jgi:hypothetical protein
MAMKRGFLESSRFLMGALPVLIGVSAPDVQAHPTSYKGGFSVMTWNQPFLGDTMLTYTFARNAAVAARHMRMDMPDGEMQVHIGQLNWLAKRWNEKAYQANVYFFGGMGAQEFQGNTGFVMMPGVEADIEDRRLYLSGKFQALLPKYGPQVYQSQLRAGIAAYESEFDEVAAWLVASVQFEPQLTRQVIVTPMARFFYRNVLWEVGAGLKGDWMLNFMFHI